MGLGGTPWLRQERSLSLQSKGELHTLIVYLQLARQESLRLYDKPKIWYIPFDRDDGANLGPYGTKLML